MCVVASELGVGGASKGCPLFLLLSNIFPGCSACLCNSSDCNHVLISSLITDLPRIIGISVGLKYCRIAMANYHYSIHRLLSGIIIFECIMPEAAHRPPESKSKRKGHPTRTPRKKLQEDLEEARNQATLYHNHLLPAARTLDRNTGLVISAPRW